VALLINRKRLAASFKLRNDFLFPLLLLLLMGIGNKRFLLGFSKRFLGYFIQGCIIRADIIMCLKKIITAYYCFARLKLGNRVCLIYLYFTHTPDSKLQKEKVTFDESKSNKLILFFHDDFGVLLLSISHQYQKNEESLSCFSERENRKQEI